MKVNHDKTKNLIFDIAGILREQARYAKNYRKSIADISADTTYSQDYKSNAIAQLRTKYDEKYHDTKEKVVAKLDEIVLVELENESVLEFDIPEFSNTVAAINATQGKLPAEVMESIKLNFAGHYQVLSAIKAAFDNYDIDLAHYKYEEYTTSAAFAIETLKNAAENIEYSETATIISLHQLFKDVIHFGEVRGIEFSDDAKTFGEGVDDEVRDALARRAMGLI